MGPQEPKGVPFWATRTFRLLVLLQVMVVSTLAVLIFEIGPRMRARHVGGGSQNRASRPASDGAAPIHEPLRFEGILEKTRDGTPIDVPDEAYAYLIRHVSQLDPEALGREARTVPYEHFATKSSTLRGRTIRVRAIFLRNDSIRLPDAPGNVEWVHRVYLMDASGKEGYVVDLIDPPTASIKENHSAITVEAIFLKLGTYEGRKGAVQAPLLIGRRLSLVPEQAATGEVPLNVTILCVGGLALVIMLFLTLRLVRGNRPPKRAGLPPISSTHQKNTVS